MQQTVIQIGNSAGIILPQDLRQETGIKTGDKIMVKRKGSDIILSKVNKNLALGVNAKFAKMVDEFITEHEDALRELAKR